MANRSESEIHDPLLGAEEGQTQNGHCNPVTERTPNGDPDDIDVTSAQAGCFPGGVNPASMKLELLEAFDSRQLEGRGTAGQFQTVFNTINLYVGVGLVTMGYAVALGGWASLGVLLTFSCIFCFSAQLLCRSFEKLPPNAEPSYPGLGSHACGPAGQWAVLIVAFTEFFGAACMCLIVTWQSVALLFPPSATVCLMGTCLSLRHSVILGSLFAVFPSTWLRGFSRLTGIAISGVSSSLLLTAVVIVALLLDPASSQVTGVGAHQHTFVKAATLPTGAGIMIVSLSGHAGLPSLRRSMKQPQHFERCLYIAFGAMFAVYALMGAVAYQYFGESCSVLVTHNLATSSSVAGWNLLKVGAFQVSLSQLLSALVALSTFSTISPLVFVLAELIVDMSQGTTKARASTFVERTVRTVVLAVAYALSILAYDVLGYVESLVGGVASMCSSLLLPGVFYYVLHRNEMGIRQRVLVIMLVCIGAACAVFIAVIDVQNLRRTKPTGVSSQYQPL